MCVTMHKGDPAAAQIPAEVNPTRFHHPKKMSLVLDACGIVLRLKSLFRAIRAIRAVRLERSKANTFRAGSQTTWRAKRSP